MTTTHDTAVTGREGAWHQSGLESLLNGCSFQFALTYKLGLPTTPKPASEAGTAVHAGIEAHELQRKLWWDTDGVEGNKEGLPLEEMITIAEKHLDNMAPLIKPEHYPTDKSTGLPVTTETLYQWARNALQAWYNHPPKGGDKSNREWLLDLKPLRVEPYFKQVLVPEALPIAGWVDGVYQRVSDGKIIIVDEKTAKDFTRWKTGHRLQATVYSVAIVLDEEYPVTNLDDVEFWYLINRTQTGKTKLFERAKTLQVKPTLDDVKDLVDMIREAERVVEAEEFIRNPGWGALCSQLYCPFFTECMVTGEYNKPYKELKLIINNKREETK